MKEAKAIYERFTKDGRTVVGSGADKEWEEPLDKQVGGNHYASMTIQPVEFITANNLGFLEGNVVKYICRHHAKNGAEDIKKAIHYCELLLQTKYGEVKGTVMTQNQQKVWQGLSDDEIETIDVNIVERCIDNEILAFARAIEAKLKENNT